MIGLFDSGAGGLCVLKELRDRLPHADFVYYGDTRNLPYGGREAWELLALGRRAISFLAAQGATAIVSACGTISSVALPALSRESTLPLYGVLEPTAVALCRLSGLQGGRIALLATRATVACGRLAAMIEERCGGSAVLPLACPSFVDMAERGGGSAREIAAVLAPLSALRPRAVVLGCTHFSLLSAEISACFPGATIIDSARETARAVAAALPPAVKAGSGQCHLYTSGNRNAFARVARSILGEEILL